VIDRADPRRSRQHHCRLELPAQDLDDAAHTSASGDAQGVTVRAPDQHRGRAERQRLHHVGATLDAAVDEQRNPSLHPIGHVHQGIDRGRRGIQVSPAVIRDDDPPGSRLNRALGIVRIEDSLDHQRELGERAQRFDVLPGCHDAPWVHDLLLTPTDIVQMRGGHLRGQPEPRTRLAVARSEDGRIHGDTKHLTTGLFGLPHNVASELLVGLKVQLEPEGRRRRTGNVANRRVRGHAHDPRDPGRCGATRGFQLAIRMQDSMVGGRGQQDRERQFPAEQRHARVDRHDVAQHPRPQPDPIERLAVPAQRVLLCGAGCHEFVGHRRHRLAGEHFEFGETQDVAAINPCGHSELEYLAGP
jgi:hypothetical protein